jgi:transketolase
MKYAPGTRVATRDAYGETLVELGRERPDLIVLDSDLSSSTKTATFRKEFPGRFFNFGVAEQNMIGHAAGLAATGLLPFASTFAVFAMGRVFDQVRVSVCYPALNVKIVASHAGLSVGEDGASHQANEDIALARVLPNMTVVAPADANETRDAVRAAAGTAGPFYLRLGRPAVPVLPAGGDPFVLGRLRVLREGKHVAILACGLMVHEALRAAEQLAAGGIEAGVIDAHTIKPLDAAGVEAAARRYGCLVTAEEHSIIGGLGSAVTEVVSAAFPVPVIRVGVADRFGESGAPEALLEEFGLSAAAICRAARRAMATATSGAAP